MKRKIVFVSVLLALCISGSASGEEGVSESVVRFGSVLALKGKAKGLGVGMKMGLEAALAGERIKGRTVEFVFENDFYEPSKAVAATERVIERNVFLMIGNVGTPTAVKTLPILRRRNIPAVGFFTGAEILRSGEGGPIVNYRASYVQETAAVIESAVEFGIAPRNICAYVQNDGYGMSGLAGIKMAMKRANAPRNMLDAYDVIMEMSGDYPARNDIGPVGVYTRNSNNVGPGYGSLKNWEKRTGTLCKLVVTVGAYANIGHFVRNAKAKGEKWIVTGVSFTGADSFLRDLKKYKATERVVMTQVVPLLESNLPIVREAESKLGRHFGFVSLEGYIVGRMILKILNDIPGELTRDNLMKRVKVSKFDLGGLAIDFTKNGNQGSDLVVLSYVTPSGYRAADKSIWDSML